ncbi:MAG TPA: FAD-binding oxidoreductase [Solirubrobacterales bacterium]|nr:FAD-binding oxidoreductase [Solirubrobacterales bacterium]
MAAELDPDGAEGLDRRELLRWAGAGAAAVAVSGELALAREISGPQASVHVGKRAIKDLERRVSGRVFVRGGGKAYHRARKVYNKRFNRKHPAAVIRVRDAGDVQAVMRWANKYDVNVRARSGGHSYAGYSTTDTGVVIDLSKLRSVNAQNGKKQATVGGGVGLIRMYSKLAKRGVTVPGGSCPTVGISGLALGGGMGFASRKHGLTCDNIESVQIVTPDGKLRTASAKENQGLLWACQGGGGGNFGIVTEFTFRTYRVDRAAYYFASWPWEHASHALEAWQKLTGEAPDDLCPFFSLSAESGGPVVGSVGQYFGSESGMKAAIKPLTDIDGIELTTGTKAYAALMKQWAGCSKESLSDCEKPNRVSFYGASDYVQKAMGSGGRHAMIKAVEARQNEGATGAILLDGYGGKINEVGAEETAFVHRNQLYCIQYYAQPDPGSSKKQTEAWIQSARKDLRPHVSGQAYQNYIDPKLKNWTKAYYGRNYDRLVQIKTRYDPDNRLGFKQGINPS